MDGTSGRKEFSGARQGWRLTCKLRDENGPTIVLVAFTEQILWLEEQAALHHDKIVRVGPLTRKENSFTGKMDLHLCATTQIVSTTELSTHISTFPELCGYWPSPSQWDLDKYARLKGVVVKMGDGDLELLVCGDTASTRFQVYGLHPALIDIGAGATLLVEVFPMAGGGETPCKLRVGYVKPLGNPGRADFLDFQTYSDFDLAVSGWPRLSRERSGPICKPTGHNSTLVRRSCVRMPITSC